ncbi:Iridoid synthase [Podospora australis]|uniref:Iridoid synthase n=1 Tax=Podospora australis TaxID=1536484 RepID=A0AAN7AEL7_9PEZI|nr:Iridoid synthase [Podospora australis]
MSSAIVLGATGILGREIVKQLSSNQLKWNKIYALSRSKKDEYPSHVVHSHIDLLTSAEDMAKDLKDVEGEYVFFAAYMQQDSEEENCKVNGDMLSNFLRALTLTNAVSKIKRILLVTGCKQYGVHLGQPKNPMLETDPWLRDSSLWPPNFYHRQQDILREFCENNPGVEWTVTYPNDVIGFANGNFMNLAEGLGIYAAVSKELGENLTFPGSETFYNKFDSFTSSKLHAEFCEWAVTEPKAANQAFNVVNGDVQSWQDMWPRLAQRFGMKVEPEQFADSKKSDLANQTELPTPPPISLLEAEAGLKGRIKPSALEQRISLAKWAKQEKVKQAWEKLAEREGLQKDALEKGTWAFVDFVLGRNFDIVVSMSKAREAGWTGYADTWKSLSDVFGELEAAGVLPKTH